MPQPPKRVRTATHNLKSESNVLDNEDSCEEEALPPAIADLRSSTSDNYWQYAKLVQQKQDPNKSSFDLDADSPSMKSSCSASVKSHLRNIKIDWEIVEQLRNCTTTVPQYDAPVSYMLLLLCFNCLFDIDVY